ncbi:MAG TPA: adenylate/guanylate cyclase domain-containing protein [Anaerolineae bacterium]
MAVPVETLAGYVPALVIRHLAESPGPVTTPSAHSFPAAVLFADISGFTAMTERLARQGPAGVEEASHLLNDYFGQLIERVAAHGGDVIKFAGDALLALWPATEEPLDSVTRRAAQCGLAAQKALHGYMPAPDVRLSLRASIGAGEITEVHIGGVNGRWEYLIAGAPLARLSTIKQDAQPGDVIISPEGWSQVQSSFEAQPLDTGGMRLEAIRDPLPLRPLAPPAPSPDLEPALRAYIPNSILDRLAAGQTEWLAELRRVTVIFLNLRDLDHNTPKGLKQAQMVLRALQAILYRYEATIDKISIDDQGATMVAALGLPPLTHEDDAARGAQAALDIQAVMRDLGLHPAVGVATGLVFCGSVGSATRREYTMVGDVVNLAARLMQNARDDLLCDAATAQAAQDQIVFETLPPIRVKGKADPVTPHRPRGLAKVSIARPQTALIGRVAELTALEDQLQRLMRGEAGGTVAIEGEAGIGKSRLAGEVLHHAQALGMTVLLGSGDAIEKNTPYHAWQSVFSQLFGLETIVDADARRQHVLSQLQFDEQLVRLAPLLGRVLPIDFPENEDTVNLTGQARADRTRDVLLRLLSELPATGRRAPKVLVMEDAHWFDSASWTLVLLASRQVQPMLLIVTTRLPGDPPTPEYAQLIQLSNVERLRLDALPPEDTLELVCQRLNVTSLPEPVIDLIRDKAEGHPFFSEELAYALRDTGLIRIDNGECHLAPGAGDLRALTFPDTIQGVITSRIDRLTPPQQMTVKAASAIGRVFPYRILYDIHPIEADKPHLPDNLATLQRLNLTLLDTPEPDLAYLFKHAITQEVAYNLMLFAQRRQLHRAIAEWYEHAPIDDRSRFDQLLAHHWGLAGEAEKAIGYLERAGHQAAHSGANAEAKALYEQALETLLQMPVTPDRQRQLIDLTVDLARVGAYLPSDNILTMLRLALDAAQTLQDEERLARVHGSTGAFHYVMGRLGEAQEHFTRCMALAEKLGLEELLTLPYNTIGRTLAVSGDYARAADMLAKGIALAEKYHDPELLAGSLAFYASTFWFQGRRAEGIPHAERGLALAEEIRRPSRVAGNLMVMGFCTCFCGFFDEAAVYLRRCLSIAEPKQYVQPMYIAYGCMGYLQMQDGDLHLAREYLDNSLQLAEKNKAVAFVPLYQAYRAEVELLIGDAPSALARAEAAVAAAEKTRQRTSLGEAQRVLGRVYARLSEWEKAEQAMQASLALQKKCNALPFVAISTFDLGRLYRECGRPDEARAAIAEATRMFEDLEMAWHLDRARQVRTEL